MTEEQKVKLLKLAEAIGKPEIDYFKLEYHFLENAVMFTNQGNLVGMVHRGIYETIMKSTFENG